jgi:hypothetical protein
MLTLINNMFTIYPDNYISNDVQNKQIETFNNDFIFQDR